MKAAVIGLGYVGLPLAVEIARAGIDVIGIDVDEEKIQSIKRGESYIKDVPTITLAKFVNKKKIEATGDFSRIKDVSAMSICVPTPLSKMKDPDISFIVDAVDKLTPHLKKGHIIVLESTTFPGTTEEIVLPALAESGLQVGKDFYLAFSPERVDPGNKKYTTHNIPKVVGGVTSQCTKKVTTYYKKIFEKVHPVSSSRVAEMVKLLENTFRSVNIALVNEFALMCDRLELDVWEIIDAAATKPFGFMSFYPGPGLGGHCIPIDPFYLSWKLRSVNYHAQFIDLASDINTFMPQFVVNKVRSILNSRGKPMKDSLIYVLGVAYKKDISDARESPAMEVMRLLRAEEARIAYHDPFIPRIDYEDIHLKRTELTKNALRRADCTIIITDHSSYDYQFICDNARMVFDSRNATKSITSKTPIYKL